jgi:O-methyltransferase involved in polyketide biosynthesis
MLWTVHNRACEAMRPDAFLLDPACVNLYRRIDYDFVGNFGQPDGSHAARSKIFDDILADWLVQHPQGRVVELACGLETQFQRMDNGKVSWLCVDLPEAIEFRRRLIAQVKRCRHLGCSAFDSQWLDYCDRDQPTFISAQGLLMYFDQPQVQGLVCMLAEHFSKAKFLFDSIPLWLSQRTVRGWFLTRNYRTPCMPWGISEAQISDRLLGWHPNVREVQVQQRRPLRDKWQLPSTAGRFDRAARKLSYMTLVSLAPP